MKKRFMALVLALVMCVGLAVPAVAANVDETTITLEEIIASADKEARKFSTVTDGQSNIDHEEIDRICQKITENHIQGRSSTQTAELATVFSKADGVGADTCFFIALDGNDAQKEAAGNDSYRHFTWNFRSAISRGEANIRVFATNYEWGNVLLNTYLDYYNERLNYYYDNFPLGSVSGDDLMRAAIADADDYIVIVRNTMISDCKSSKAKFIATFNSSNIMDFWNNEYGRRYASRYPNLTRAKAYETATNDAVIIISEAGVTSSHITTVYNSHWWHN